jgi:hypothetical protein
VSAMDALHTKVIWREGLDDSLTAGFFHYFVESMQGRLKSHDALPNKVLAPEATGETLHRDVKNWTDLAETFYVDPRMMELVTAASESMPQETLVPRDIPADFGFMLIPGGIRVIDVRGKFMTHNAVLWAVRGGHVTLIWLSNKYDQTDQANIELKRSHPQLFNQMMQYAISHVSLLTFGEPLPVTVNPGFMVPPEYNVQVDTVVNTDGSRSLRWSTDKGMDLSELMNPTIQTDPASRWLLTVWRLMQQSITSVADEYPSRQVRRQLERKNMPDRKVSVIALRHTTKRGDGTAQVEWSHRWLRRGHWRNQPCKEDGEWTTRYIYIHPTICGPEDKPLLVREHIYSLVR